MLVCCSREGIGQSCSPPHTQTYLTMPPVWGGRFERTRNSGNGESRDPGTPSVLNMLDPREAFREANHYQPWLGTCHDRTQLITDRGPGTQVNESLVPIHDHDRGESRPVVNTSSTTTHRNAQAKKVLRLLDYNTKDTVSTAE
jgi:hypothetical protein